MAEEFLKVIIDGEEKEIKRKTLFLELAKEAQPQYEYPIVLASLDNRLKELNKGITKSGELKFITVNDSDGLKTYRRSLTFLMERAVRKVIPKKEVTANVLYSIGNGYYCELTGGEKVTPQFIEALTAEMKRLVEEDLILQKESWSTEDAISYFAEEGMRDKESLFRYRRGSRVNMYVLDGYRDYYYGYMVPSTGYLKEFGIESYESGFVLTCPRKDEKTAGAFVPSEKLYHTLREFDAWGKTLGIETIGDLNDAIVAGSVEDVMLTQEALMEKKIGTLAELIASQPEKKFVMIAGPPSATGSPYS